jgi:hypothetical protein
MPAFLVVRRFEPIHIKARLHSSLETLASYQGTTSVVPKALQNQPDFTGCGKLTFGGRARL